jgi:hypothetical protein
VGLDPRGAVNQEQTTMKKLSSIALLLTASLVACGDDDKPAVDAPKPIDAPADIMIDALVFPAAPTLGTQIDRMGRPAVNTALNATIDADPGKTAKKDAYNRASMPSMWSATVLTTTPASRTILQEFMFYIGVFDALDQASGLGGTAAGPGGGCGNGALFNMPAGAGYGTLATVLSNDELYVDTGKNTCLVYLSVEVDVIAGSHTQCGGRTLTHDVVDSSYSLLAAGVNGFNSSFSGLVTDGVVAHTDVDNAMFPFLGPPH